MSARIGSSGATVDCGHLAFLSPIDRCAVESDERPLVKTGLGHLRAWW